MNYIYSYQTPFGKTWIAEKNDALTHLFFHSEEMPIKACLQETKLISEAHLQLNDYLEGKRRSFCLPLNPEGSEFQRKVWCELEKVPFGQTRTYSDIARALGNDRAARAVGGANNKNPLPVFIPCHRIIGKDGSLVGYEYGLDLKARLLNMEKECAMSKPA